MRFSDRKGKRAVPLQNRVDPFGDIHAVPWRGTFTGNRGVIHDPATKTLLKRRWTTKAWIICTCDYRGRRRAVMGRNAPSGAAGWTELFFLDEVTALAAGHRPCYFCRRERADAFAARYANAFGVARPTAPEIDARLHAERLASGGRSIPARGQYTFDTLPDGAMLCQGERCFAKHRGALRPWTFSGYGEATNVDPSGQDDMELLTPPTTLAVLMAGYRPDWHRSIGR